MGPFIIEIDEIVFWTSFRMEKSKENNESDNDHGHWYTQQLGNKKSIARNDT